MSLVREFEENAAHQGHQSLIKEARTFAEELGIILALRFPHPKCRDNTDGADDLEIRRGFFQGVQ